MKTGSGVFGAGLHRASDFRAIGRVLVVLRKQANAFQAQGDARGQVLLPMRRQGVERAQGDEAMPVRVDVACEPFIRGLRVPVKRGFDVRDDGFVNARAIHAGDQRVRRVVAQGSKRPCAEPSIYVD